MDTQQQFLTSLSTLLDKITLLSKEQLATELKGYKPAEVHTIEYIGQHPQANVTQIATALFVTRGAVSKLTKRLMTRGLIERYQQSDNRKEIYFSLTPRGQKVFDIHARLHQGFQQRDQPVFDQADPAQLQATLDFLKQYNDHLDAEITKQGLNGH